jgi:prepilin-type N-terminal cleavage/methylation domain-containing protein
MFRVSSFGFLISSRGDPPGRPYTRNATPEVPNPGRPREAGFTLLELLISMTILALILATVLGAIRVGSKSWESGEQRAEENQRTRTLFDTVALELTMVYPLRVKDQDRDVIAFRGKSDSLSFATLPQSYGAEPFSHMMRIVTYGVQPDRGLVATEGYPLVGVAGSFDSLEGRERGLDARVSDARFRYLVPEGKSEEKLPPTWRDYWDPSQDDAGALSLLSAASAPGLLARGARALRGSDRLPLAVEITLTIRQGKGIQGGRELVLPPLVFPVHVGRTL